MESAAAIRALTGLRITVGVGAWVAPRAIGKAFLLAPDDNPQSPYLARLFGARDAALAYGVADTFAAIAGGRRGYLSPVQSAFLAAPALAAVAMGVVALQGGSG